MNNRTKRGRAFPQNVECLEHVTIPLSDGTNLAAKIWLPEHAEAQPVPAILEYIPYRKRDIKAYRDSITHPYFAGHGYAGIRVDLRGSGDSEGVLQDEYLQQELDDGVEVIKWIAQQPWCDGSVGMIGISWGGFNGLQIAAMQPEELKAVITLCSTDDRYADDVHYMGGCLLTDNLSWASTMFLYNSCPPDPALAGDNWMDLWKERLKGSGLWLKKWLEHQHRDEYWKHGSVCEDFSAIRCPVFAVSGWADGYSNAVFRLLQNLDVPRKGLIGAWGHQYPHLVNLNQGRIDFLNQCVRWWDQWLKGASTAIMDEPMLTVWMQDHISPLATENRPGRWVGEDEWPSDNIQDFEYRLQPSQLLPWNDSEEEENVMTIQSPLSVGLFGGKWCSYSADTDLPNDQREEDGGALIFDTAPLEEDLEILGSPEVEIELSSNRPVAMVAARLSDVAPDDNATRVTYGLLNLTHRNSHEEPEPLEPGKRYRIKVQMNDVAQVFRKGHSIRLALSTSYWPLAWAPPEPVRLTIIGGKSMLRLPMRLSDDIQKPMPVFGEPDGAIPIDKSVLRAPDRSWTVTRDLAKNLTSLDVSKDDGLYHLDGINWTVGKRIEEHYSHYNNDFESLKGETRTECQFQRGNRQLRAVTRTILTSTKDEFKIIADLDAYDGKKRVYSQSWDETIPRKLV